MSCRCSLSQGKSLTLSLFLSLLFTSIFRVSPTMHPPSSPPYRAFYKTLRERVDKYFKDNNIVSLSCCVSLHQ